MNLQVPVGRYMVELNEDVTVEIKDYGSEVFSVETEVSLNEDTLKIYDFVARMYPEIDRTDIDPGTGKARYSVVVRGMEAVRIAIARLTDFLTVSRATRRL